MTGPVATTTSWRVGGLTGAQYSGAVTTSDAAKPLAPASPTSPSVFVDQGRRALSPHVRGLLFLAGLSVVLGGLLGVAWYVVVDLPSYVVDANSGATSTERGLTEYFSTDAWFVVLGLAGGAVLGLLTWWWFGRRGWMCVPVALAAALMAALTCWGVGLALGPDGFDERIATAQPGDRVEIDFALRSWTAVVVWPFAALAPILVGSSLAPETPRPRGSRRRARAQVSADSSGDPHQHRREHQSRQQVGDSDSLELQQP